ncbi:MAG: pyridoxal-dependent decarboxylase [Pyrinomonadaceae bacterium]
MGKKDLQVNDWFIAPDGSNKKDARELILNAANMLIDFLTDAENSPTLPKSSDIDFAALSDFSGSSSKAATISNLDTVLRNSMNPANPGYIGHMDSIPGIFSIVGDLYASAINNNLLAHEMSPFLTDLERNLTGKVANLFGLGAKSGGIVLSGGTLANLQALAIARNNKLNTDGGGFRLSKKRAVLFTSELAHVSIEKCAMILGLGRDSVIKVKTDKSAGMDFGDLREKIESHKKRGDHPFCVVATAGTTTVGSIDPLRETAKIAKQFDLWFHADAIYGGALAFSKSEKHRLDGIELADSVSFNPHKWLYVSKTASLCLFRDFELMRDHFQINAPYMNERGSGNLGELTIQGSKHAEILKLWLTLTGIGKDGFEFLIAKSIEAARNIEAEIGKRDFLETAVKPELNIICFRITAGTTGNANEDKLNEDLQNYLLKKADIFVSLPRLWDKNWLRIVLLNPYFKEANMDLLFKTIDEFYRENFGR